jgi:hypothetical protein
MAARVVPSQAVALMERAFGLIAESADNASAMALYCQDSEMVSVVVDAVERIPPELITLDEDDYVAFAASLTTLRHALEMWPSRGDTYFVGGTPGFGQVNPIILLRQVLLRCADDAPIQSTGGLDFITDKNFRESLRRDVSTAHTAVMNGEWKPATVMAGSVVEALLLWALQNRSQSDIANSVSSLVSTKRIPKNPGSDLLHWSLQPLIEVGDDLGIIKGVTASQCRIAKDFRNLIHPGKAERLKTRCTRGTALSAVGAMEQVIEDLS